MAKKSTTPKPPAHLSAGAKKWFAEVVRDFQLETHHVKLLQAAAECWDRLQEARRLLKKDGAVCRDRFGQLRAHPSVQIERDSRLAFARLIRELRLDDEVLPDIRPPRLRGRS